MQGAGAEGGGGGVMRLAYKKAGGPSTTCSSRPPAASWRGVTCRGSDCATGHALPPDKAKTEGQLTCIICMMIVRGTRGGTRPRVELAVARSSVLEELKLNILEP